MSNHDLWLRQLAVAEHEAAREDYERRDQRSQDLTTLANALECFFDHPNTPEGDKVELAAALERLLGGTP